jgi:Rrf2 family transcriptional regulator, cysteine metabolism repressor
LDLALIENGEPVPLKDIAQRQKIPLQYLEHLITPLITIGIIRSVRGARGGIMLARPASEITLFEVIQVLEGPLAPTECVDNPGVCERSSFCVTRDVWDELKKAMESVLGATTLQDLVDRHRKKSSDEPLTYYV